MGNHNPRARQRETEQAEREAHRHLGHVGGGMAGAGLGHGGAHEGGAVGGSCAYGGQADVQGQGGEGGSVGLAWAALHAAGGWAVLQEQHSTLEAPTKFGVLHYGLGLFRDQFNPFMEDTKHQ